MTYPVSLSTVILTADFRKMMGGAGALDAEVTISGPTLVSTSDNIIMPRTTERLSTVAGKLSIQLPVADDPQWLPNGWDYLVRANFNNGQKLAWLVRLLFANGTTQDLADFGVEVAYPGSMAPFQVVYPVTPTPPARLVIPPVTVPFNASLPTDASGGNYFRTVLTANFTLANPTNPIDSQRIVWELTQDATGGRLITLGSAWKLGSDIPLITLSVNPNVRDYLGAVYNAVAGKWDVISFVRGY